MAAADLDREQDEFVVSLDDFASQSERFGWEFWRGFLVGVTATIVIVVLPGMMMRAGSPCTSTASALCR